MNNTTISQTAYLQGFNNGKAESKETIAQLNKEVSILKKIIHCKHLRNGSTRIEDGYLKTCLNCGHKWFEQDRLLTDLEKLDKANFERELKAGKI